MDGVTENVKEHFRDIHATLYNSVNDGEEIVKLKSEIDGKVDEKCFEHVYMVTPEIIREATKKLIAGKSDPVFSFSSDCFKHGQDSLYKILSFNIWSFLFHGHVPHFLLLATLVPIIKDKLGSQTAS